jgi:2-polyprenyl-6-hydroxyphenyl methylase/3-demethylubiquinone-9 3-methyltransferase
MNKTFRWKTAQIFEYFWWKIYLHKKEPKNYLHKKREYWKNLFSKLDGIVTLSPETKILDAGCGPSGIYMVFNEQQVTAVDPLLNRYKDLTVFDKDLYPNVEFIESPLELYIQKEKFDLIFCMNVINHVSQIEIAIQNLSASLKPEGKMIVTVDAHNINFLKKIFQKIPGDILHPHQLNKQDYIDLFENNGLSLISSIELKQETIFSHILFLFAKKSN